MKAVRSMASVRESNANPSQEPADFPSLYREEFSLTPRTARSRVAKNCG